MSPPLRGEVGHDRRVIAVMREIVGRYLFCSKGRQAQLRYRRRPLLWQQVGKVPRRFRPSGRVELEERSSRFVALLRPPFGTRANLYFATGFGHPPSVVCSQRRPAEWPLRRFYQFKESPLAHVTKRSHKVGIPIA